MQRHYLFPKALIQQAFGLALLCASFSAVHAQSPPGLPDTVCPSDTTVAPANNCASACVLCGFDRFFGSTALNGADWQVPSDTCAAQPIDTLSVQWTGFVAGAAALDLEISVPNCGQGDGLQFSVWATTDCQGFSLVSDCYLEVAVGSSAVLELEGLTVGATYFLVTDGGPGSAICDFSVEVVGGNPPAPPVGQTPSIDLPSGPFCVGFVLEAMASEVPNAGYYNWTVNGLPIGNGSATLSYLPDPLLIGQFELCVTPGNQCRGDGPASCITFSIEDGEIPPLTLFETICEGETYDFLGTPLTQAGVYLGTQTVNGCTQEVELFLEVASQDPFFIFEVICQGDSVVINDSLLTQAGNYEFLYPNAGVNGCDSLLIVNVETIPPSMISLGDIVICENELPYEVAPGAIVSTAGPFNVLGTAQGFNCPDLYTGYLIVVPAITTNFTAVICEGEQYELGGQFYDASGTYQAVLTAADGCDSTLILELTVQPAISTELAVSICEGEQYELGGEVYDASGTYQAVFPTASGCDSTVTLDLTVAPALFTELTETICEGEQYELGGQFYDASGTYQVALTAVAGCDSTVTLDLTVAPNFSTVLIETICPGEQYELGGEAYDVSGTYQAVLTTVNGCDSTVTLELTVEPDIATELTETICAGEQYELGGAIYDATGTYQTVLIAANGCDSTVTLELTVEPAIATELTETICAGEEYQLGGEAYDASGTYQAVLTAANGCDSSVTLDLTVEPVFLTELEATICEGEEYGIDGEVYTVSGTYQWVLTAVNGCDSTVTLDLTVLPNFSTELTETICAGETYELGGEVYGASGTYQAVLIAGNGCDSTVTLNLEVLPALGLACPAGQQISLGVSCEWTVEDYTGLANVMGGCGGISIEQSPPAGTIVSSPTDLTVTLSAKDENDDEVNCSFVLSFVDDVPPVLPAAPADADYVCLSDVPAPSSLTATDNCAGEISALAVDSDNGGTGCAGDPLLITRTWVFEDGAGNASSISQSIRVEDEGTPPRLACLDGRVRLPDEADYALSIADVLDIANSGGGCGELTVTAINPISLGCDDLDAPVEVMVTAEDECGRENRCTAIIIVEPAEVEFPAAWERTALGLGEGAAAFERCDNDGEFTLTTTAQQLPFDTDNYQFVHQEECGEITLTAQITQFTPNGWQGLFIRNGLGPADAGVAFRVRGETMERPANVVQVQSRQTDGGGLQAQQFTALSSPYWLRLVSAPAFQGGRWVQLLVSADGENWDGVATATIAGLGDCVQVGLIVQSTQFGQRATTRFANVKLTTGGLNNSLIGTTGPVAVGEDAIGAVNLWPNPADNRVHLAFETPLEADLPYVLRNQLGQLAGQGQLKAGDAQVELDLADLPAGLYFLQLAPQKGLPAVLRFIKQ